MISTTLPTVITAIVAIVSPMLTAVFTKSDMNPITKNNIALLVSFGIAGGYVIDTTGLANMTDLTHVAGLLPVVYAIQQAVYHILPNGAVAAVEAKVGFVTKASAAGAGAGAGAANSEAATVEPKSAEVVPDTPAKG